MDREEKRVYLLNLLGGKCIKCNSTSTLEFDHLNPSTKSFKILGSLNRNIDSLIEEAKKCQLLCYDCHTAKHGVKEVEHGGGTQGKWKCKCALCLNKKAEYDNHRRRYL